MDFPIRINKYLELKGFATRRGADDLIKSGLVMVNDKPAIIGYKVQVSDKVEILAETRFRGNYVYFVYNKPRGLATEDIVCPENGRRGIKNLATGTGKVFPLGRLDKESEGLIILTNDGRLTDRLLNPKYQHEKEYEVEVREKVSPMHKRILEGGVNSRVVVNGFRRTEKLKAKQVEIVGSQAMRIILTEGKKHQIRRMLAGAHLTVKSLKRVRIMHIKLSNLAPGKYRELKGVELETLLSSIGLI